MSAKNATNVEDADVLAKRIVRKSSSHKKFDYAKVPDGKRPYRYIIRDFAYSERVAPYKDPDTIILAVIEQEVKRFVKENFWVDMVYAGKVLSGKTKRMKNESDQMKAAVAIYETYLFFTKEKPRLEKKVDMLRGRWARCFNKRLPIMQRIYKKEGKPLSGYEDVIEVTISGRKRKLKVHRSPEIDKFNLPETAEEKVRAKDLRNAEVELDEKCMKAYRAVIDNIHHLWV